MGLKETHNRDLVYLLLFSLGVYTLIKEIYIYKIRKAKNGCSGVMEYHRNGTFSWPHIDSHQVVLIIR